MIGNIYSKWHNGTNRWNVFNNIKESQEESGIRDNKFKDNGITNQDNAKLSKATATKPKQATVEDFRELFK